MNASESASNWRLTLVNALCLGAIALSPTLGVHLLAVLFGPGQHTLLALLPALPFLPFGGFGGELAAGALGSSLQSSLAYALGMSITVFALAYLCLVNRRYVRARKTRA